MNSFISESAAEPLIFGWDSPRREKLAITIFLALSLMAHALCFYIFQIVYPPTIALSVSTFFKLFIRQRSRFSHRQRA